jgi:hypothetical protein
MSRYGKVIAAGLLVLVCTAGLGVAQETRRIQPITSPTQTATALVDGGRVVKEIIPVDRETVERTMRAVAESWNTADMAKTLAASFQDKDRLTDSVNSYVPRDARLRLISVGSYRVLRQEVKDDSQGALLVSRISVIARTQIEYNDPAAGFQTRQGEQEYVIKISQRGAK